jgi:Circularly permutated YpsA SLOG family
VSSERRPGRGAKRQVADRAAGGIEKLAPSDHSPRIEKIISGGQTGVDRAALDVALAMGIDCGGWCPKGRRAEDGAIPSRYPLAETASPTYSQRTKRNVRDSDGTLILSRGQPRGGTLLTQRTALELGKPCLSIDLGAPAALAEIREWLDHNAVGVLNVAGPRESQSHGITLEATRLLHELLAGRRTLPKAARTRKR